MRILQVIHTLEGTEGPTSVAKGMCAGLTRRGHDVTLMATGSEVAAPDPGASGYELRRFPVSLAPLSVSFGMARALRSIQRYDIVHLHMLYRFPQAFAAYMARRHGVPYCMQPHGCLDPVVYLKPERRTAKRLYEHLFENRNLGEAAGLIFTTKGEREAARSLGLETPSYIVPVGVSVADYAGTGDGAAFRKQHRLQDKKLVLWMGRLVPVKRLDLLLSAFASIASNRSDVLLVLAGPDPEGFGREVRQLVERAELSHRVLFTGNLSGQRKHDAFDAADVFVLPSQTENFGIVALEALATGCPVILSEGVKIWPDVVAANAGLATRHVVSELSAALQRLLDDGDERRRMGTAAKEFARRFEWPNVIDRLEDSYGAMIDRARKGVDDMQRAIDEGPCASL